MNHVKQYINFVKFIYLFIKDYHTTGHTAPILDQSQDWVLLYGEENNNGTILKFTRKLDTCDPDDIKITVSYPEYINYVTIVNTLYFYLFHIRLDLTCFF